MVVVKEIKVKSVLSKSQIYDVDYSINPYIGCEHACIYCFARHFCRKFDVRDNWGKLVYVKINAPRILKREVKKACRGVVLMSSITDPYQPIERRYEISRRLLEILAKTKLSVIIMTKSNLVTRDIDIIKELSNVEVGVTITTSDENISRLIEPQAPTTSHRIEAISKLTDHEIKTFVFMGPFIPIVSEIGVDSLISELKSIGVSRVVIDTLNIKRTNLVELLKVLEKVLSMREIETLNSLLSDKRLYKVYYWKVRRWMMALSKRYKVAVDFAY